MTPAQRTFQYRGDLSETTLPEILHTIDRFQVPGTIEARREGVVKQVYIKEGHVLNATSSDLTDSLGGYLRRSGRITEEEFVETMQARRNSERRYGVLLIEAGLLSPSEVYSAIRQQIEEIVWSLFYWREGKVSFEIGAPPPGDMVHIQLPMRQVILQGIKRAPSARELAARLGPKETRFEPAYRVETLIEAALEEEDYRLLRRVDGRRTLYELCTQGPLTPADSAKRIYAFRVLGLIRRAGEPEGASNRR